MKKKILITGGAGYIGSHIVKLLGESGHDLIIYDNLSTGRKESVLFGELVVGDLADTQKLKSLFLNHQFDGIIHFAGSIVVPESVSNPTKYYQNNTANSLKLIELAKEFKVNRFIFSSTAATYGDPLPGKELDESHPQNPASPYGSSKLMTEWMLRDQNIATPDFNFIALRYFNVSGADLDGKIGQCFPGATHLIKVSCEAALGKREELNVFGSDYDTHDGTGVRDYIHVVDLAQAHLDAFSYLLDHKKSHFLNCGYGKGTSVKEVVAVVKEITGVDFKVNYTDRRPGDVAKVVSKADKIKDILKWKPLYNDINLMVKTAYEWEKKLN